MAPPRIVKEGEWVFLDVHTWWGIQEIKVCNSEKHDAQVFDGNLPIYIETDASKKGIGVVLMQLDPNVQNTSKLLYPITWDLSIMPPKHWQPLSGYIEREMLGVVLHFKHFTYGHQVTVIMNHRSLITLFKKNIAASSTRLSQMPIKITDFQIDLQHQEGSKM